MNLILSMACYVTIIFSIVLYLVLNLVEGAPEVPCYFIFGDSLLDNGNNNDLDTAARANYPPYGVDFPDGPTGRFTNGRNIADFLGLFLFLTFSLPLYDLRFVEACDYYFINVSRKYISIHRNYRHTLTN